MLQREEFDNCGESKLRQYPQLQFIQAVLGNQEIVSIAFEILMQQCTKLKYGCDDFVSSLSFVEHFYAIYDKEYLQLVDTEENLNRLGFTVTNVKPPIQIYDADDSQTNWEE